MAFDAEVVGVPVFTDVVGGGRDLDVEAVVEVTGGDPVGGDDLGSRATAVVGGLHGVRVGGGAVDADAAVPTAGVEVVVGGGGRGTFVLVVNEAAIDVVVLAGLGVEDSLLLGVKNFEAYSVVGFLAAVFVVNVGNLEGELALVPVLFENHLGLGGDGAGALATGATVGGHVPGHVALEAFDLAFAGGGKGHGAEVVGEGTVVTASVEGPLLGTRGPTTALHEVLVINVVDELVSGVEGVESDLGFVEDFLGLHTLAGGVGAELLAVLHDVALAHGTLEGEASLGGLALPGVAVVVLGAGADPSDGLGELESFLGVGAGGAIGVALVLGGEGGGASSGHGGAVGLVNLGVNLALFVSVLVVLIELRVGRLGGGGGGRGVAITIDIGTVEVVVMVVMGASGGSRGDEDSGELHR